MVQTNLSVDSRQSQEISLKEVILKVIKWLKYLKSKWILILASGLILGVLFFGYGYLKKPLYVANLSFALEDEKSSGGLGGALGLASQFGIDLGGGGGGAFAGDNLLELIKSRSIVEKTLLTAVNINGKDETLADYYIDFNKFRSNWAKNPTLAKLHFLPNADRTKFSLSQDSLLGVFHLALTKGALTVSRVDKKVSIISVVVKSKNELFSKFFAEILVKKVSEFYIQTKTKKASQNVSILQHQTDSVRRDLNMAISGVASSMDAIPNPNAQRLILRTGSQRRQVDVQANTAILTELVKNLEIAKVSLRRETPLIQIIDSPILPLEKQKPQRLILLIEGMFLGAFFMAVYLLVKEQLKKLN